MSQHAALHLQLHTPTGITHTASAYLTHASPSSTNTNPNDLPNLVVVRNTVLEVYSLVSIPDKKEQQLHLLTQQRLFGVIESLAVLTGRTGGSGHDAVLLTFRDAKLSVLQWNPATANLEVSSLHYFEGDESLKAGRESFPRPPLAVTDPQGRCAAVVMLRHQLAVLPATESEAAVLGFAVDEDLYMTATPNKKETGRTSIAAAVGNSYIDNLNKLGIREVRDAVFLHGCAEPTLLILHEVEPSWAGGLRTRKDTCVLSALSINMTARRHPKIWGAEGLPTDCYRMYAVPTGGALVFCSTGVLFYSQSQQAGIILHSSALPAPAAPPPLEFDISKEGPGEAAAKYAKEHATELPPLAASAILSVCDTSLAGWNVECDTAHATWISNDTAMVGLKSGQLLLVQVQRKAGGSIKLRVAKAGAAPRASCMAGLGNNCVFIGSIASDSLLVGYEMASAKGKQQDAEHREAKRQRLESTDTDTPAKHDGNTVKEGLDEAMLDEDDDAMLLYGDGVISERDNDDGGAQDLRCSLKVLDSFIGIGPVRSLEMSQSSGDSKSAPPYMVACCGEGRGGALAVLRRVVAPDIVTEVPLPGVTGAWAVGATDDDNQHHEYLLLSLENSTKVLATGAELKEVTNELEFAVDTPTMAAGTVCGGTRVVQAYGQGLRLLEKGESRQEIWATQLEAGMTVTRVHIIDPYILVQFSDDTARLLVADETAKCLSVMESPVPGWHGSDGTAHRLTACCLYKDSSKWLARHIELDSDNDDDRGSEDVFYVVAVYEDGSCCFWSLPLLVDAVPSWHCRALGEGGALLVHHQPTESAVLPKTLAHTSCQIKEIQVECFPACPAPMLVAVADDNRLLAYAAFCPSSSGNSVRFKKLQLDVPAVLSTSTNSHQQPRLTRFDGLGEKIPHSGIFVSGDIPMWLIAARGTLFAHPSHLPNPGLQINSFAAFDNVNCPRGFILVYAGTKSCLQIAGLPPRQRLDAPWPRQKIAIKATPIHICLYPEAQLFVLAAAKQAPHRPFLPEEDGGGEPQASFAYALGEAASAFKGNAPQHEIRLLQPGSWATLWHHALLPGEQALVVEAVHLCDHTTGATVPLIAVGAGFAAGEDYPCGGRLLLFEVKKKQDGSWGACMIFAREFKGPITGLATMEGHLLLSTGNRLETCTLSTTTIVQESADGDAMGSTVTTYKLQRSAFYDGPSLICSLATIKSFALLGDASHSVQFVRYREEGRQLGLLGRDFGRVATRAAQFIIAGSSLHIASADAAGTIRTFTYAPGDAGSWKGQKLIPWGVLHIGQGVSVMLRAKMPAADVGDTIARQAVLYGSDSGALGIVCPVVATPVMVDALRKLSRELQLGMAHAAGLHPGAFRRRYSKIPAGLQGAVPFGPLVGLEKQGIVDGDLLFRYGQLPKSVQVRLAAKVGMTNEEILRALGTLMKTSWLA